MRALHVLIIATFVLVSCSVGPGYEPPAYEVPDAWNTAAAAELDQDGSPLETWWLGFDDPTLTDLIDRALAENLTLQAAASRVYEARARLGIATGRYYPDAIVDASYSRSLPSDNGPQGALAPPGGFEVGDLYTVGVGFAWEIDVFGRLRRGAEAARADLEASIEDYRDILVILMADVAANYVDARTLQERLRYGRANVEAQRGSLRLTRDRFDAGLTSARDVAQAESNLANSEAQLPPLEAGLEAAVNRLAVLLGEFPGAVDALLESATGIPASQEAITIGLPADLMRRRPDIRRAERQLAAQTARIGVATADLYPTFSLSGVLGLESITGGDLLDSDSTTWALVPGLRWNIFTAGKVRNQIRIEEARTQQAFLFYQQNLLLALEEVEDTLVAYERERVRRERLREAVTATERTVELVSTQYKSGLTDFLSLLDAQRSLAGQQDSLAASEGQVVQNLIALNRALGGGWTLPEPEQDPRDAARSIYQDEASTGSEP